MEKIKSTKCFSGEIVNYSFYSTSLKSKTSFNVYYPLKIESTLLFLSGLTCTENNFMEKSGAIRVASKLNMAIVCPDTSPRGVLCKDDEVSWDFGKGAGYYLDAITNEYKEHYNMNSYLHELISKFSELKLSNSIHLSGHSMGGHGALTFGLKNPKLFTSISVFAPICNPINVPWGQKAFKLFLGDNMELWKQYDASELVKSHSGPFLKILLDQGSSDTFLKDQLQPQTFVDNCKQNDKIELQFNMRDGYDHSYYFISSFIEEQMLFHFKNK